MEYLHLFETQLNHDSLYEGDNYKEPWIAYTLDNASVTFNKPHDYSKDYFTIEALEDGNVYFKYLPFAPTVNQRYIEYSKDNGKTWTRTTNVDNTQVVMTIPLLTGEKALVRGDNDSFGALDEDGLFFGSCFYSDIKFNVSGNIMSLINGDNFINDTNVLEYEYMFLNLFYDKYGPYSTSAISADCMVVNAKNLILPATELTDYCYYEMFYGCTELTTAPELPATTLIDFCYSHMFHGCTSLNAAPALPATILAYQCYYSMFYRCSSLTSAPDLPATVLTESCYSDMFAYCTALTTAPALPATSLANECYSGMFSICTLLNTAPELPATTLAYGCYSGMFSGCTSLTTPPALPATTLAESCYSEMFRSCTALTATPELPANTLANSCYSSMFWSCTSLTTAAPLPASTLAERCYYRMFRGCKSLTAAPELHANVLAVECYRIMFTDCSQLNSITMLATNISAKDCLTNWVNGVASTGTFVKASSASLESGVSGIPSGWTVVNK